MVPHSPFATNKKGCKILEMPSSKDEWDSQYLQCRGKIICAFEKHSVRGAKTNCVLYAVLIDQFK